MRSDLTVRVSDATIASWVDGTAPIPPEYTAYIAAAVAAKRSTEVVHPVPNVWDDIRPDIQSVYLDAALMFPTASTISVTGSRANGRWRDADDSRWIPKRHLSDYDIWVTGVKMAEVYTRVREWNSVRPEFLDAVPSTKCVPIPKGLWSL